MFKQEVDDLAKEVMCTSSPRVKELLLKKISYIAVSAMMDSRYAEEVHETASRFAAIDDGLSVPDREHF